MLNALTKNKTAKQHPVINPVAGFIVKKVRAISSRPIVIIRNAIRDNAIQNLSASDRGFCLFIAMRKHGYSE
jgi:hypothetical protein